METALATERYAYGMFLAYSTNGLVPLAPGLTHANLRSLYTTDWGMTEFITPHNTIYVSSDALVVMTPGGERPLDNDFQGSNGKPRIGLAIAADRSDVLADLVQASIATIQTESTRARGWDEGFEAQIQEKALIRGGSGS